MRHQIINTPYGEILCKESKMIETMLDCFIGTDFDTYIGSIRGSIYDNPQILSKSVQQIY